MTPQHASNGDGGPPPGGSCRVRRFALAAGALACAALHGLGPALAQLVEERPLSLYGAPGMLDMPSARFMPDGSLTITAASKQPDDRITVAFQALPWLETTARYSVIYGYTKSNPETPDLYDRSLGFKVRLLNETQFLPALAVGVLDVGGTVVFGGEYFVASKKFGPVDATLGLGLGRLGSQGSLTNPFALAAKSFRTRAATDLSSTGKVALKQLFHGEDAALFGGVVIDTPVRGLQLLAEYSGDKYKDEEARGIAKVLTPINVGVSYRPARSVELGLGFMQGHVIAGRLSLRTNFKDPPRLFKLDPPPPSVHVRTPEEMKSGVLDTPSGAAGIGLSPNAVAPPRPNLQGEIANPPDWTIYPPSFASSSADLQGASASVRERLNAELKPLQYRVESTRTVATALEVDVSPIGVRPAPTCDEVWRAVSTDGLIGIEAIHIAIRSGSQTGARCVKFLSRPGAVAPVAEDFPVAPSPKSGWWQDKAYVNKVADAVSLVLKRQRLVMESAKLTEREAVIHFRNPTYPSVAKALGRAARGLTQVLPPSIEMITLVLTTGNLNGTRVAIPRGALERAAGSGSSAEEVFAASMLGPAAPGLPRGSFKPKNRFPAVRPIFVPAYRQNLFDPDDPLRIQLYWRGGLDVELFRGLIFSAVYDADIYNNFKSIKRESDSELPHVRSDVVKYLQDGASGLEKLELAYLAQLAPEVYGRLSVGYLEDMYGGVDGEILWRPFGRRWAVGLEAAHVYKRDFDRKFGFQDFNTTTGHLSLYYESPWYGLNFNVHAGRYLAGDWGATFEVARRFDNGAEVSAYATFTDVPFDVYGEGSFDKGISIRFPFDLVSFFSTQQAAKLTFKPLTRDGGARLSVDHRLYEETRPVSYGETVRNWGDLLARR